MNEFFLLFLSNEPFFWQSFFIFPRPPMLSLSSIRITEDGEAIGTLRQFARSLNLSCAALLERLHTEARDCIILCAGTGADSLLILDPCGLSALVAGSPTT